jgi:hypothetical protein
VRRIARTTLTAVFYQRAPHAARPPAWSTHDPHPVEAIYLQTAKRLFKVYWADEFHLRHGFGVAIAEPRVIDRDAGPVDDVSGEVGWRDVIGSPIATSSLHWHSISDALRSTFRIMVAIHADHLSRSDYPAMIELGFETGAKRYLSAAVVRGDEVVRFSNHMLVTETV